MPFSVVLPTLAKKLLKMLAMYLGLSTDLLLLSYFEKNSSYVSGVGVCIFVALYLSMFGCLLQEPIRLKVL